MQKIAAIGLRVSSEKQSDEGYSLPSQLRRSVEYAKNQGLDVPEEYVFTEVFTGTTGDRPELTKIKALAQAHRIDALVVFNADRFFRNRIEAYLMRKFLHQHGVELHYAEKARKVGTGLDDEILNGVEELIAEVEKERIKERTMRGRWERAQSGSVPGQSKPPYGYMRVSEMDGKKRVHYFEINPEQANIVRLVYTWYTIDRWSVFKIRDELTRMGVPAPGDLTTNGIKRRPYAQWHHRPIYRMLQHEAYSGRYIVRRYQEVKIEDRNRVKVYRPEAEWITIPIPAIVEESVWNQAQIRLASGKQMSPRSKKDNPAFLFRRRIKCSCGAAMRVATNTTHNKPQYYQCLSGYNVAGKCSARMIKRPLVDEKAWAYIESFLLEPFAILTHQEDDTDTLNSQREILDTQLTVIEDQIVNSKRRREAIIESIIDARIQGMPELQKNEIIASLNTRLVDTEKTLTELENQKHRTIVQLRTEQSLAEKLQVISEYSVLFAERLAMARESYEFRRGVLDDLDIRVTIAWLDGKPSAIVNIIGVLRAIPLYDS